MIIKKRLKIFSMFSFLLLALSLLFLTTAFSDDTEAGARLGIFVKSRAIKGELGKFYYKQPQVECWLDDKLIYQGPVRKGDENVRIFHELIFPGEHQLKFLWKVRIRGDEAARVKLGGRRIVDWIYVPEQGFAEYDFNIQMAQTKAIQISVFRTFELLENKGNVQFREKAWPQEIEKNHERERH